MAFFDFLKPKKKAERQSSADAATVAKNKLPIGFYVSPADELAGEVKGNVNVLVQGTFEGEIDVSGLVWVGRGAKVAGVVRCEDARLEGHVSGVLRVRGVADIVSGARCEAELVADRTWRDGAFLEPQPPEPVETGAPGP